MNRLLRALLCGLALCWAALAAAQQAVPPLTARVNDTVGLLSTAEHAALDAQLAAFEQEAGSQLVVLIVASTAPEDIAAYAQRVADTWKIGRRAVGDGLLIVVSRDERRTRIEVAKALEGAIPDLAAKRILDEHMRPAFKAGQYAKGLSDTVEALAARIRGEALPTPQTRTNEGKGEGELPSGLLLFFFLAVPVLGRVLRAVGGRRGGSLMAGLAAGGLAWWLTQALLIALGAGVVAWVFVALTGLGGGTRAPRQGRGQDAAPIFFPGSWGGGGGGSGGFSSGGGGDFGGGGASGDW